MHAIDKKDPGERAALCALGDHYGQELVYQGPTFASTERAGAALKVHFSHTDGGLVAKGKSPQEFAIAGKDQKFYWADARIAGDTIILSSSSVPNPVAVRYGWQAYPAVNLYNGAGLPAVRSGQTTGPS